MSKGNFFTNDPADNSALGRIKRTLSVNENGSVTFKTNLGRGSGTPVEIPGDSFDSFVTMMQEVAAERTVKAEQVRQQSDQVQPTSDDSSE